MIFNIQRFSTHDGGGIRTIIFYKGCTLQCQWCSNPESQSFEPEIMFDSQLCQRFGDCLRFSPAITVINDALKIERSELDASALTDVCLSRAISVAGQSKTTEELILEIEKDSRFYSQSGGGVTLSGGEPFAQGIALKELLQELRRREIDVAVETTLHVQWSAIQPNIGIIHTWLVDIKHTDATKFMKFTGGNLALITGNLCKLSEAGVPFIARIPVIPLFNHTFDEISSIIDFTSSFPTLQEIHLIPFHNLGIKKYTMLDMPYAYSNVKAVQQNELIDYLKYAESKGIRTRIGG
ncbi:MAG TPA: glycyl-radical enzyme activating protein [Bacteroidales bacterium]|nr:glycyl-radical enzyme activating protein [Bacteroidales bacterium]